MKRYLSLLFLIWAVSCAPGRPSDVLSREQMQDVLWDVARGGEFINGYIYYKYPDLNKAALNNKMMDEIFRVHKITKKQFDKSLAFYKERPAVMLTMLDTIEARKTRLVRNTASGESNPPVPEGPVQNGPEFGTGTPKIVQ